MTASTVRLLLLEDSETAIAIISDVLAKDGEFNLTIARTLAEARAFLAETVPDLVIADLTLPDGKGTELLAEDREQAAFPVIVLTGNGNEQAAVEAMKAGALDYLVKSEVVLADTPRIVQRALREWRHIINRKEAESRLRSFFNSSATAMAIISAEGRFVQVNPASCRIFGYTESDLLRMTVSELTSPGDREETQGLHAELMAGRRPVVVYEKQYLRKDGSLFWGHVTVAVVLDADGKPGYLAAQMQDVTHRKQMEDQLRRANRELDGFVHTVSHDLRSPLSAIISYTEYLNVEFGESLGEEGREVLAIIHQQGVRMLGLLEDLLALATAGQLARPEEPVDCGEVVDQVVSGLANQLHASGMAVRKESLPNLRVPRAILSQLFDNLIGNAVRYAGGSTIEVGGERSDRQVSLYVRDYGVGIPLEERDRIFDRFYRGSSGKDHDGTGLGLATVQKIAQLFGGSARVEATPGGGSTFRVDMLDAPPAAPAAPALKAQAVAAAQPQTC